MMKKIIFVIFLLHVFLYACWTKSSTSDLKIKLSTSGNTDTSKLLFTPADYSLPLNRISVMTGSNSGIEISWIKKEPNDRQMEFILFLPSSEKFKVRNADAEKIECEIPDLPFVLTEKDFDSVYSVRVHQKINAYMSLGREVGLMSDASEVGKLLFSSFTINVQEFSIDRNYITMKCEFSGSLAEEYKKYLGMDYLINGNFSIDHVMTGIMNVDD